MHKSSFEVLLQEQEQNSEQKPEVTPSSQTIAKPNVIRRLSSRELLTDFVQSMQCNMINCGELSIKDGVEQYIESINGMMPDGT